MKIDFLYGNGVVNLPAAVLPTLADATADQLRVLITLAAEKGNLKAVSKHTGISDDGLSEAISYWVRAGVILAEGKLFAEKKSSRKSRPSYSGEDMERIAAASDARELVDVCGAILGKTFTASESESLFYLYDGLRLDFEFVVKLCKHCHDIGKPSIRYVEKVGISLYDEGVTTVGALDSYINKEERKSDMEYRVRRLFGIGERALTPKEREYLACWTIDWDLPFELIELAYNDMMGAIREPKFSYENGILKKWAEAGIRDKEGVAAFSKAHKKTKKSKAEDKTVGFDLDEFFEAATRRGVKTETDSAVKNGEGS